MEERTRSGFLAGVLVGVAAGLLVAPRRGARIAGQAEDVAAAGPPLADDQPVDDRSAALRRKIEETRRRLRAQVDAGALE